MAITRLRALGVTDGTLTNTQINASAAIAKTKLAALDIVNADVNASAAIVQSKMAALTGANMPASSVIQIVGATYNTSFSANSQSYVASATLGTITTTIANSKILTFAGVPLQIQGINTIYYVALRSSVDSYASNLIMQLAVNYSTGDHMLPYTGLTFLHSPSQSAGTAITYKMYVKNSNNNAGWYMVDLWGTSGMGLSLIHI